MKEAAKKKLLEKLDIKREKNYFQVEFGLIKIMDVCFANGFLS